MTYVPTEQDYDEINQQFATLPETGRIGGFAKSVAQFVNPVVDLFEDRATKLKNYTNSSVFGHNFGDPKNAAEHIKESNSPWMSPSELKKKYTNVSFSNWTPEYIAKRASERKYNYDYNNAYINSMPSGFLSGVARYAPSVIGNFAAVAATDGLSLTGAIGLEAKSIIGSAAAEAVDFNAFVAPGTAVNYRFRKQIQEPVSKEELTDQVITNSLLGGVVGGLGATGVKNIAKEYISGSYGKVKQYVTTAMGEKKIMTEESHEAAIKTAKDQVSAGQKVNIDNVVKQGMYQERQTDPIPDDGTLNEITKNKIEKSKKRLDVLNEKLGSAISERDLEIEKVHGSGEKVTASILEKEKILAGMADSGINIDRHVEYGDRLLGEIRERRVLRPIDKERLDLIKRGKDVEMLKRDLDRRIKRMGETTDKELDQMSDMGNTNARKITEIKDHIESLEKKKHFPFRENIRKIRTLNKSIDNILDEKKYHDDIVENNDALSAMREMSKEHVTKADLKADLESAHSIDSDASIDKEDLDFINNKIEEPEEAPKAEKEAEGEEGLELSEKDVEDASDFDKENVHNALVSSKVFAKAAKAFEDFKGCMNV